MKQHNGEVGGWLGWGGSGNEPAFPQEKGGSRGNVLDAVPRAITVTSSHSHGRASAVRGTLCGVWFRGAHGYEPALSQNLSRASAFRGTLCWMWFCGGRGDVPAAIPQNLA